MSRCEDCNWPLRKDWADFRCAPCLAERKKVREHDFLKEKVEKAKRFLRKMRKDLVVNTSRDVLLQRTNAFLCYLQKE